MRQASHSHFDDAALFGVHALACLQAADTLKGGHQTPPEWQNENCWRQTLFRVRDYDLKATLTCGQAFRWEECSGAWEGVVGRRWVRLRSVPEGILAETVIDSISRDLHARVPRSRGPGTSHVAAEPRERGTLTDSPSQGAPGLICAWPWLEDYLQTGVDLDPILAGFPDDEPMRAATIRCHGLRLLRQDAWECLASFILSSTKQIVQIRQIIAQLCERFGETVAVPSGHRPAFAFPTATRLADCTEAELRSCKMGFRAPSLLAAARAVAEGELRLAALAGLPLEEARAELCRLRGVGPKIADCVLLFGCGFSAAFPMDVWIMKALRDLYFPKRRPSPRRLRVFAEGHFLPYAGYAQQYLFHHIRLLSKAANQALA